MTTPRTRNLIALEHVDESEGLATRVTVHETIRSIEMRMTDVVSWIISHEQRYVEVWHGKDEILDYRTIEAQDLRGVERRHREQEDHGHQVHTDGHPDLPQSNSGKNSTVIRKGTNMSDLLS